MMQWVGLGLLLLLGGFVAFCFRQGEKTPPSGRHNDERLSDANALHRETPPDNWL